MFLYSFIMFPVAILFIILSIAIYKGKTQLIHDYHQTYVKDKEGYGKEFGKALGVIAACMLLSGIIGLFGDNTVVVLVAVAVLFLGIIAGLVCIYKVQKKYNNGIF